LAECQGADIQVTAGGAVAGSSRPTVGIACPQPIDDRSWSGIPAGMARGLDVQGVDVVHLTGSISMDAGTARSPAAAKRVSAEIRAAVAAAGRLDGVVQMGAGFTLPPEVPYVTFEDVTVVQALAVLRPPRSWAEAWVRRQAEAYSRAAACCVASDWAARSVLDDYGVPAEKLHVVGFGANLELDPRTWTGDESPRFLFVGKSWERKGGPAVLSAFAAVRREFPTATLDLVGNHPRVDEPGVCGHGPLLPAADPEREVSRRSVLRDLFGRATCFVMPSRFEPFGIAYVEAGSAGVPSIGTSIGGAADAIGPGGVLVDPGDETALREAMLELCMPETARRLGRRAREHAAKLTWDQVAARVLAALGLR